MQVGKQVFHVDHADDVIDIANIAQREAGVEHFFGRVQQHLTDGLVGVRGNRL